MANIFNTNVEAWWNERPCDKGPASVCFSSKEGLAWCAEKGIHAPATDVFFHGASGRGRSMRFVDYRPVARSLRERLDRDARAQVARRVCTPRSDAALQHCSAKRSMGDVHADSVLETLDMLGVTRTPGQKLFHQSFFNAVLPHIYGSDQFEQDRERILSRYGFSEVRYEVLVICPRRWGKTYGVSMFLAALLWCARTTAQPSTAPPPPPRDPGGAAPPQVRARHVGQRLLHRATREHQPAGPRVQVHRQPLGRRGQPGRGEEPREARGEGRERV